MTIPRTANSLVLRKSAPDKDGKFYHDVVLQEIPLPELRPGELLVKVNAVAFNRRDLWMRYGLYPGIQFNNVMGSDAAGEVIAAADYHDSLLGKRVFLTSTRMWEDGNPPEDERGVPALQILGCSKASPSGVFAEYVVVDRDEVIPTPDHLDDEHIAAWPVAGVTAWRACMVNGNVTAGSRVLITGAGGGVAVLAVQLCAAAGAEVFVTSGSEVKIKTAVELGAKGGVSYKADDWPSQLQKFLGSKPLDVVIDSGGGDIMQQIGRMLKSGGKLVCYGMTAKPSITLTMREVLKNQQIVGSTMGSREDFAAASAFLAKKRIVPAVSHILDGLEESERGFDLLKTSEQIGKVVMKIRHSASRAQL